jgi:hypothetical protein
MTISKADALALFRKWRDEQADVELAADQTATQGWGLTLRGKIGRAELDLLQFYSGSSKVVIDLAESYQFGYDEPRVSAERLKDLTRSNFASCVSISRRGGAWFLVYELTVL